jgi:MFS family permease
MLLILEIILTIFAWRRGWKWYALLPLGIAFAIGFLVGLSTGASGGLVGDIGWVIVFDIAAVIALIVMCAVKPKSTELPSTKNDKI